MISKLFIYPIFYKVSDKILNILILNYEHNICYLVETSISRILLPQIRKKLILVALKQISIARKIEEVLIESDYFCR